MAKKETSRGASATAAAVVSDVPDYRIVKGLNKKIAEIASRLSEIHVEMAGLKAEQEDLKIAGAEYLITAKVKSVMVEDLRTTLVQGEHKSLSRTLLVKHGVDEDVIDKSYSRTPYITLLVTKKKEKGEKGEEE